MERKSWDEYFLGLAKSVSTRATCNRLQVGCVITKHNRIVSTGYNGSIRGHGHCTDVGCALNEEGRCIRTIHAEANAIVVAKENLEGATAYVTHEPCESCTKLLLQSGVRRVVFEHAYKNSYNHLFILKDVEWHHFAPPEEQGGTESDNKNTCGEEIQTTHR